MVLPFPCCPVIRECSVEENLDRIGKTIFAKNSILDVANFLALRKAFDDFHYSWFNFVQFTN